MLFSEIIIAQQQLVIPLILTGGKFKDCQFFDFIESSVYLNEYYLS